MTMPVSLISSSPALLPSLCSSCYHFIDPQNMVGLLLFQGLCVFALAFPQISLYKMLSLHSGRCSNVSLTKLRVVMLSPHLSFLPPLSWLSFFRLYYHYLTLHYTDGITCPIHHFVPGYWLFSHWTKISTRTGTLTLLILLESLSLWRLLGQWWMLNNYLLN